MDRLSETDGYGNMIEGPGTQLNERARYLFKTLVERFIRDGQPVGSRTLSRDSGLDLSPATVRNVMADLEELGLLRSPHTSAGRVPTVLGYRFFVDTLLKVEPLDERSVERMRQELDAQASPEGLLGSVSELLSEVTHLASVVTVPRHERIALRHLEFLPLSDNRVLVIIVLNDCEVQNRIIRTERRYSRAELKQAARYLNERCVGRSLVQLRAHLLEELRELRESVNRTMVAAVEMAERTFTVDEERDEEVLIAGQTHLMEYGELADMDKLRQLFEAFREKRDLLHLLDQSLRARGVQIFIGSESGFSALDECTVIAAPYGTDDGEVVGVLGVVGPTRLAYDRVIPVVDITARLLGAALKQQH